MKFNRVERTFIDDNFVKLYETCANGDENEVRLTITPSDTKMTSVTITAKYLSTSSRARPKITRIEYDSVYLKVKGELLDALKS